MKRFIARGLLAILMLSLAGAMDRANAQGLSGQIGGSVIDGSGAAIPGATVSVRNTTTAVTRETTTDGEGLFVFTNLFAGTYDLRVTLTGFRTHEKKAVVLTATERVAVPPVVLEVGGVEEVVTVEASALHAQAQSGERSGTIRADEIKGTQLRGRDFLGLLQGMPGVVDTNVRNAPGWNAFLGTQINGLSDQLMGMSYDGVSSKDTGFGAANYVTPSLDSISEVKIQTSNYQAEYGRAGGANIIVVTKSGSSRFSGSAAYFKRHEGLTTNPWDRRRTCDATGGTSPLCEKPRYRYDNSAFTLGGPVLIPGSEFNDTRDKLFFFYSLDLLPRTDPFLVSSTMPSALERIGDFSQTRNNAGQLRFIRNPFSGLPCNVNTGGAGCFANNVIPQNMIHPMGRQMLNLFPLPDPALVNNPVTQGEYNYQFAGDTEKLRRDHVVRADWNIRPGTTFYTRVQIGKEVFGRGQFNATAPALIAGAGMGFPWSNGSYDINTSGYVATLTHTFSSTTVLEVIAGTNWAEQDVYPLEQSDWDALDYRNHLPGHRQFFTENNPNHILPDMTFLPPRRQRAAEHAGHRHRPGSELPLAGDERHAQLLGEPDAPARQAQHEGRVLLRADGAARPAVEQRRHLQLQLRRGQSARHQPRVGERGARAPQPLHRKQQQPALDAGVQPARVLPPGQLAHIASVHARPRRPLLAHRRRPRPGSGHRLVRSVSLESGERGGTVAAALRQRRVPVHRRESGGAESGHR